MTSNNSKLFLTILSLLSIVLLVVLILDTYNIRIQNRETSELFNSADRAAETRTLVQSTRLLQSNAAEDLATFDRMTLSGDKLVPLIESIEGAGRALGLKVNIVSVGSMENVKSEGLNTIRIVLNVQGSWASTLSFLRAIESLPHRVMIEESSFSKEDIGWRSRIILALYSFD